MYRRSARKPRLSYTWRARSFPRPIACPVDERLADALVPVIRCDPDVIEERVRLRRQEPALAQDHVAEGLAGRPFRDPPFRPISFHERLDLLPEVILPRPAIESRSLVLGQVIPYSLQGRGPDQCEVRATRAAHAEIDGSTAPSSSAPVNDEDVGRSSPCRLLSRPSLATQNLYGARPVQHIVPPSRCVRCGAVSRDYLCASCIDYLIAYHPLWLNPALLPGPSLLDLVAPRESPLVSSDLSMIEWESPRSEPSAADAVQLIRLLGLEGPIAPTLSVGDADLLHRFLRDTRRSTPTNPEDRDALAQVYRYLSRCAWMPSHLASEYRLRADTLSPGAAETAEAAEESAEPAVSEVALSPPLPESTPTVPEDLEPLTELPSMDLEPEEETPGPGPDPFRPLPEPPVPQPQPEPEPEPEEAPMDEAKSTEFEAMRSAIEAEKADLEARGRSRAEELRTKETFLVERERALASKEREVEAQSKAVTDRLVVLEKDAARRDVLRFLGTVPGMSEAQADVIASAFPDMASLESADAKALTQCQGVTDALARAIRYELVPGEVDEEQVATRLQEEALAFLGEGDYEAALDCYDRLLRDRPEQMSVWFDRAELLVLLGRKEEALESYQRVIDVDRGNRRAWFERANLLFGLDRLPEAIDALKETLRIDPAKSGDIVLKAEQLRRDGHPNEAVVLFQTILDVNPAETRAVLGLGDALLGLGDSDTAEALFTQALGKNPQNAMIVFRKGELLEQKGRWGAAIQYYNRAIALKWNFVSPWLSKAKILLDHGRASEALECFDKVMSFDAQDVEAWAGKARAHAVLGNHEAASDALHRSERLDPENPSVLAARKSMGVSSAQEPEPGPVRDVPEQAPREPEEEPEPEPAGDFHSLLKAFEEIEEEPQPTPASTPTDADFQSFIESIEPDKEQTQVLLQLAELALEGGDAQMALLRYEQAIEQDDRNADAWTGKGVSLQQLERYREALGAYDRALSLQPGHELATKWRATCLRHLESEESG